MYKLYNHIGGTFQAQATIDGKPGYIERVTRQDAAIARVDFPEAGQPLIDRPMSELHLVLRFMSDDTDGLILVGKNHLSAALGFNVDPALRRLRGTGHLRYSGARGGTLIAMDKSLDYDAVRAAIGKVSNLTLGAYDGEIDMEEAQTEIDEAAQWLAGIARAGDAEPPADPTWEYFQNPANRQRVMDNITEQEAGDILDIVNPIGSLKHLHSH